MRTERMRQARITPSRPTRDAMAIAAELRSAGYTTAAASTSVVCVHRRPHLHVYQGQGSVTVTMPEPSYRLAKGVQLALECLGHASDVLPDGSGLYVYRGMLPQLGSAL